MIAGCITPMLHENFIIGSFLRLASGHISFSLLGDDISNSRFLGFEVISDCFRIIRGITFFKYRFTFFHSGSILDTISMHSTTIQIHRNNFRSQFDVLIIHFSATIKCSGSSQSKDSGVVGFINNRCIEWLFLLYRCDRINAYRYRICFQRIISLKGIRLCGIGGNHSSSSTLRRSLIGKHQ